jgi:hypothetical protein
MYFHALGFQPLLRGFGIVKMKVDVVGLFKLTRDMLWLREHDLSDYYKLINMPLKLMSISFKE